MPIKPVTAEMPILPKSAILCNGCSVFSLFLLKIRQNPYKKASFSRFFKKKIEISCKISEICLYLHQICGSVKEKQRADMAFTGLIRHEI